ncbi:MAG: hypothetical protein JXB30_09650 [Anaerolineae bacterium]|nr:hypothetical protein [Anaerolineae bacterium]
MPVVGVPLLNDDEAYLRLNDIYALTVHKTFGGHINYLEAPLDWETYLPGDQDWIVARMKTVYAGLQSGTIGEGIEQQEPLPITVEVEGARHELGDLLAEIGRNRERDRGQSLDM